MTNKDNVGTKTAIERSPSAAIWNGSALLDVAMLLAILALAVSVASAQNEPSLGDVARKSREEHTASVQPTGTASQAKRLASELQEREEESSAAPTGFETYSAEGYLVAVPAPFSIAGRDDTGVLLATAEVSGVTTKVFAAAPLDFSGRLTEIEFQDLAARSWGQHGKLSCTPAGLHEHRCSVNGSLFGNTFMGRARFVESDNRIFSVVCFATEIEQERLNDSKHLTREQRADMGAAWLRNNHRREMTAGNFQLCDTVLDSMHLKTAWAPQAQTATALPQRTSLAAGPGAGGAVSGDTSLAAVARDSREEASRQGKTRFAVEAQGSMDIAPPGYVAHTNTTCSGVCREESFLLPEKARHVKGGTSENVYVAALEDGTSMAVFFGHTRVYEGYSEFGRAQEVARTWFHVGNEGYPQPEHFARALNGRPVSLRRSRLTAKMSGWMEEIVDVEPNDYSNSNGRSSGNETGFSIGCIFPEERLADSEALCASVWESWKTRQ